MAISNATQLQNLALRVRAKYQTTNGMDRNQLPANIPDLESTVQQCYDTAAHRANTNCCRTVQYDSRYLEYLPQEIIDKDYGCGDPTLDVSPGETVVDLGSGAGKDCYIIAQKVGANGKVIGIDFNDEMLKVARKYLGEMSNKLGYQNVRFVKGKIQDLKLDLELAQTWLNEHPITSLEQVSTFEAECDRLRQQQPLIPDNSVDVVVSNAVPSLVQPQHKQQLFQEIYRILKPGGRAVICDIVGDEDQTPAILNDPQLWSRGIAWAFREDKFLAMFEQAGFYGIEILNRQEAPFRVIDGIEFRSVTVRAFKGKEDECWERNQAVIYKGPWKEVYDDDNHRFDRGQRMAVGDKSYQILTNPNGPYHQDFIAVPPYEDMTLEVARPFTDKGSSVRQPQETKGAHYYLTPSSNGSCCGSADSQTSGSCC
jgi:ubiquinone/menaquinone biosynthesis C-methylase UbiE